MKPTKFFAAITLTFLSVVSLDRLRVAGQAKSDLTAKAQSVLSQTSGTLKLSGLQKPVRVLRDEWGIAHIYAESQDDLFFAQGFVAAQDRLWQLDLWRRQGEGKLAEILGPSAIERDKFARLVRYRGDMKTEYESYAPDAKQIIEAFVRGVNAQIALVKASSKLPIEFQLAGYEPEAWTPEVCLTRMAGYVMTRNASTEIQRAVFARQHGTEFVDEWVETDPKRKLEIPEGLDLAGIDSRILAGATAAGAAVNFAPNPNSNDGSNNWVIDGTISATGKPLLANDPHRQIALPSLRYMVHLVAPGWNVIGAGEPGLPGVAAGHNERIGFGFTIVGIDQQDLYVEEVNPSNPNEYRWQGKWQPLRVEREQLKVKGEAKPREIELKFTTHGPVVYEDKERHRVYALKWVGSEPGTAGYLASLSLNRAKNWPEFLKALERWKVPSENLVYADVDGNIGWVAAGMTPIRKGWSGLMPVPGNGKYEWQGFLSLKDLPQSYNPAKHFIATANHNILPPGYTRELGYEWSNPLRFRRIDEVLRSNNGKFSVEDFERLQHDDTSLLARELTAMLKEAKGAPSELQPFVEMLTQWNCRLNKDSAAAALYESWLPKLAPAIFRSQVPDSAWRTIGRTVQPSKTMAALRTASPQWFGKDAVANRNALLWKTLAEAVADAKKQFGNDPAKWRWGSLHVAPFVHPLSTDAERKTFFDLPSAERGGDANTVFATGGGPGFRQSHGASFREILDVADWDRSVGTNVPGQSAQPGSKHYGDLLPLWAEGKYFPLLYSKAKVEAMAQNRLTLEPK
ncbi:MAG: penicillin acylase family protein [Acidobacteria bacterium]|nr:penicillin acylase family protein [Acidobacteriota bacterium]